MDIHVYLHDPDSGGPKEIDRKLATLITLVQRLTTQGVTMSAELDRLTTAVAQQTSVDQSVATLVTGLAQQIRDLAAANANGVTPEQLTALAQQIEDNNTAVQNAVNANTVTPTP